MSTTFSGMATWRFALLLFLSGVSGANGALMVLLPQPWYLCIVNPARAAAYNAHFVTDVGTAYISMAAALLWAAMRPRHAYPLVGISLLFSVLHAVHHAYEYTGFGIPTRHALIELAGIWGPVALLTLLLAAFRRDEPMR